jgi:predicted GH43/DUF377 family glycosyl hydrolase
MRLTKSKLVAAIPAALILTLSPQAFGLGPQSAKDLQPREMLTAFERLSDKPVLSPRAGHFDDAGAFNPTAALLANGHTVLLYRGQDKKGVSRVGFAESKDGIKFEAAVEPVLAPDAAVTSPDHDGVEDPRISRAPGDQGWFLTATAYNKAADKAQLVAYKSQSLANLKPDSDKGWQSAGVVVAAGAGKWREHWTKSGAMVTDNDGVPLKINGYYWMYYMGDAPGAHDQTGLVRSKDGKNWLDAADEPILKRRPGMFDAKVVEPGPHTILTKDGILLIYNGADDKLAYSTGWALFDRHDPRRLLARADKPLFAPETDWEKRVASKEIFQAPNVVFVEGIVPDRERGGFRVYYGCADSYVGVAHTKLAPVK